MSSLKDVSLKDVGLKDVSLKDVSLKDVVVPIVACLRSCNHCSKSGRCLETHFAEFISRGASSSLIFSLS